MARKKVQPCRHCGKPIGFPEPRPGAIRASRPKFCSDRCRLYSKVDMSPGHGPKGDCWIYTGALHQFGYGMINKSGTKESDVTTAHAFSYEIENGPIPDGQFALHRCDNPPCIRPKHLFLGSHKDNMDDMVAKERQVRGEESPGAKLTEDQIRKIRIDRRSNRDIAEDYGVSHQLVGEIRRGVRWKHIT